jgi:DNA-binding NtrC family response regulator
MPRILLVEPFEDIRKLLGAALRKDGYDVAVAADGVSAIDAMERESFGCVIVGSPVAVDVDGRSMILLEYLDKTCPEWRPNLIVITNAIDRGPVLELSERLDACAVFAKPFSRTEFMAVLAECMAGRKPAQRWFGIPDALTSRATFGG